MSVAGYVVLSIRYQKEGNVWVGICDELGVSNFGDTFEEAKEATEESVMLKLYTLEKLGERDRFFKKYNIKIYSVIPKKLTIKLDTTVLRQQYIKSINSIKEPVPA